MRRTFHSIDTVRRAWPMALALGSLLVFAGCLRIERIDRNDRFDRDGGRGADAEEATGLALTDSTVLVPGLRGAAGGSAQIFADVAEAALPSVVSIYTEKDLPRAYRDPFESFFGPGAPRRESGLGSGVVIAADGTILTNNHVIEDASRIRVQFHDGREFDAAVVGADPPTDLAVVRVTGAHEDFPVMPLGNSDRLRVGEWVLAVGSPYGLSQTVTTGIISAKGRHNTGINGYEDFLQTDAAINPGNSGGALLNLRGELVGINTAIFSRSGGYQGIGFAIPVNMARKIADDLVRDGAVTRGWLGVSIQPLDPALAEALGVTDLRGALVGGVVPGSPAAKAGLRRGDVITRIDRQPIHDPNALLNHIALVLPGTWVEVALNRSGREMTVRARITRRDEEPARRSGADARGDDSRYAALGLDLEELTPGARADYGIPADVTGLLVTVVEPDGRADEAGLREGDVVVEANRARLRSLRDFQEALRKSGEDGRVLLLVSRGGETFFTAL